MFKTISPLLLSTTFLTHGHCMEENTPHIPITSGAVQHPVITPPTIDETAAQLAQIDSALNSLEKENGTFQRNTDFWKVRKALYALMKQNAFVGDDREEFRGYGVALAQTLADNDLAKLIEHGFANQLPSEITLEIATHATNQNSTLPPSLIQGSEERWQLDSLRNMDNRTREAVAPLYQKALEEDKAWEVAEEIIQDLSQYIASGTLYIPVSFVEEVNDYVLKFLIEAQQPLSHINLRGCINITNKGLSIISIMVPTLNTLYLAGCTQITNKGLEFLEGLNQLNLLDLSHTQITDKGLIFLEGLNQLNTLDLSNTQITDKGLIFLEGLNQLNTLDLSHTQIADNGLVFLEGLTQLTYLNLSNTQITDEGIKILLTRLPDLYNLIIQNCEHITQNVVAELSIQHPDIFMSTDFGLYLNGERTSN